jgi:hypothetical protein
VVVLVVVIVVVVIVVVVTVVVLVLVHVPHMVGHSSRVTFTSVARPVLYSQLAGPSVVQSSGSSFLAHRATVVEVVMSMEPVLGSFCRTFLTTQGTPGGTPRLLQFAGSRTTGYRPCTVPGTPCRCSFPVWWRLWLSWSSWTWSLWGGARGRRRRGGGGGCDRSWCWCWCTCRT